MSGVTYQVGEFASDLTDPTKSLFVRSLKNTANHPQQGNWHLMMKNVYYLASTVERWSGLSSVSTSSFRATP